MVRPERSGWEAALAAAGPAFRVVGFGAVTDPTQVVAAAVWRPPRGFAATWPNVRVVQALGAGVDDLLEPGVVPAGVPILRLVDPAMATRFAQFVGLTVGTFVRGLNRYAAQQRACRWLAHPARDPGEVTVGVLGLGVMGGAAADLLLRSGYRVMGWNRGGAAVPGVVLAEGAAGLDLLAASADVVVNVLPLTPATDRLLDHRFFARLRPGAFLVHAGRGAQLVPEALLAALDSDRLAGAWLDVTPVEPLPAGDPLWTHPKVILTPHVAALSSPTTAAGGIIDGIEAVLAGRHPANLADRERGY